MSSKEIVISIFSTVFKVVLAIVVIMVVYKFSLTAYEYGNRVFNEPPVSTGSGRTVTVTVTEGESARTIGNTLEQKGLIRDSRLFVIQEMLSAYKDKLLPGTYELNTSMTAEEMMAVMANEDQESDDGTDTDTELSDLQETDTDLQEQEEEQLTTEEGN